MHMSDFIESQLESILQDWETVAAKQTPGAAGMSRDELRDFAGAVLCAVAHDMRTGQTAKARRAKSLGERPAAEKLSVTGTARGHAMERFAGGFSLNQMVAEYRALRASVVQQWRSEVGQAGEDELEQLTRFNEAIDESLIEAISWYHTRVEEARLLLNGALAHDLRSPLGAILASAEVLLREQSLDSRQMRLVLTARNSATRIKSMISDLLDFTRTRLGTGLPIKTEACDMEPIIRDVLEERHACHPEATVSFDIAGDLSGRWDPSRIEQMLGNLIGNALEHGRNSPVTIVADGHNDEVTVTVHNKGASIPEAKQRLIFEPLKSESPRSRPGHFSDQGLGLGLYIARQVAEAHDGGIRVDSSPDAGTTFVVHLPREPRKTAEVAGFT